MAVAYMRAARDGSEKSIGHNRDVALIHPSPWQCEKEGASDANVAFNPHPTTVRVHNGVRDWEAQSRPFVSRVVSTKIPIEHVRQILRRNSRTVIGHPELDLVD